MPQLSPSSGLMIFLGVFVCLYILFCLFSNTKSSFKSTTYKKNIIKSIDFF
uniref:ATP synthase F0 subunit 8 n=1 Tax=Galba truncatula TaxID=401862 RepID=A0A7M4C8T2_9GAST|nr:ATP synthase F0 subunit 8 [Galba truncatula]